MDQLNFVYTIEENCTGCNKCIYVCPTRANEACFENDTSKVLIRGGRCISCGECLSVCDHGARSYIDDTDRFFKDVESKSKISVIIAPSINSNISSVGNLIGYLKYMGINQVYDVSFGADICTWAHVKSIKSKSLSNVISQPCPVVVSYIEKYHPELIDRLSPIHSPATATAIYLKKYIGIEDNIMFLSPCIGKKYECVSKSTDGVIEYNVTFDKFLNYLKRNDINIEDYPLKKFDNIQGSIGFAFPRPGGLSENIKHHLGENLWIKQVEGIKNIEKYFHEYTRDIAEDNPIPDIVDVLNCEHGCSLGTGTSKTARLNEIDYKINELRNNVAQEREYSLVKHFDSMLNLIDFRRNYTDRSLEYKERDNVDIDHAFKMLGKITEADKCINCFCCGYGNCYDFAYDLALGHNDKNNCKHYLLNELKQISLYDNLTGVKSRHNYDLKFHQLSEDHPGFIGIIYADINGLKEANDTYGHKYGDNLIIGCATILNECFKNSVYRIGGDEFIVLFHPADEATFSNKVAELRQVIANQNKLAVSIGVSISYSGDDLLQKFEQADQNMYVEKQSYYHLYKKANRRTRNFKN